MLFDSATADAYVEPKVLVEAEHALPIPHVEEPSRGCREAVAMVRESVVREQLGLRTEPQREADREQVVFGAVIELD